MEYPELQKDNLMQQLDAKIEEQQSEKDLSYPKAFREAALDILGYHGGSDSDGDARFLG